ncbi:MAG: hypothetical protein A2W91_14380 [Bacteroidetes bacterium GWF2_38_335]|nr:MAG: hypothetical protein A2W91_14380 [Bacteroidetes bacterium GWF2_38_335]OFY79353.1 MAG: hypothetical protein A2281_16775 [Bacteroidetes bacterium RIFOXYA12_FULL_38_20]HBS85613.1 hypothetical protein [Bacteroidales bacterium]
MKLYDLIKSTNWLSIELTLLKLYPDQISLIDEYRKVFEKLKYLKPENYAMKIVLTKYDCDSDDESEIRTYVDVSGRNIENNPKSITESYAIEFVEWTKWLGMDIAPESVVNFTDLEIIAHCLHEMTFFGYEEDEIKEQFDNINYQAEKYKKLTEEEKKEKTITLDEIKNDQIKKEASARYK